jgi:hypothetical protein
MKKSALLTALFFALTLVISSSAFSQNNIKIGAIYDFAGGCHMYSEAGIKGIKMALEEINAKGGILGKKVEYIVRDTEGKTDVAVREVKDLILERKSTFIGPCSMGSWSRHAGGPFRIQGLEAFGDCQHRGSNGGQVLALLRPGRSQHLHGSGGCHEIFPKKGSKSQKVCHHRS